MATRDVLPAISAPTDPTLAPQKVGSLVARGLEAVRALQAVAIPIDADPEELLVGAVAALKRGATSEAIRLATPAAERGHAQAQELLGNTYSVCPEKRIRDYVRAYVWYHVASEHMVGTDRRWHIDDLVKSRDWVGTLLQPSDLAKAQQVAAEWAPRHSGNLSNPRTQSDIGEAYSEGSSLVQNFSLALKWWRKAGEMGVSEAQYNLGMAYWNGEGVPQDLVTAHVWFGLSELDIFDDGARTLFNPSGMDCLEEIEELLTPDQLTEARRRAADWMKRRGRQLPGRG